MEYRPVEHIPILQLFEIFDITEPQPWMHKLVFDFRDGVLAWKDDKPRTYIYDFEFRLLTLMDGELMFIYYVVYKDVVIARIVYGPLLFPGDRWETTLCIFFNRMRVLRVIVKDRYDEDPEDLYKVHYIAYVVATFYIKMYPYIKDFYTVYRALLLTREQEVLIKERVFKSLSLPDLYENNFFNNSFFYQKPENKHLLKPIARFFTKQIVPYDLYTTYGVPRSSKANPMYLQILKKIYSGIPADFLENWIIFFEKTAKTLPNLPLTSKTGLIFANPYGVARHPEFMGLREYTASGGIPPKRPERKDDEDKKPKQGFFKWLKNLFTTLKEKIVKTNVNNLYSFDSKKLLNISERNFVPCDKVSELELKCEILPKFRLMQGIHPSVFNLDMFKWNENGELIFDPKELNKKYDTSVGEEEKKKYNEYLQTQLQEISFEEDTILNYMDIKNIPKNPNDFYFFDIEAFKKFHQKYDPEEQKDPVTSPYEFDKEYIYKIPNLKDRMELDKFYIFLKSAIYRSKEYIKEQEKYFTVFDFFWIITTTFLFILFLYIHHQIFVEYLLMFIYYGLFFLEMIEKIFDFFFKFFCDLYNYWYLIFFETQNPIFVYFGIFFLLTTLSSFVLLSYLGLYGVFILNLMSLFLFWICLLSYIRYFYEFQYYCFVIFGKWFFLNSTTQVAFTYYVDVISYSFALLTSTIALFVYIYTFSYFRYEPLVERFLLFLNLFIVSMLILVCSGNFVVLFFGWELVGLTSFFLINFWTARISTLKAAFKAFVFNKISDCSLFFLLIVVYNVLNSFDIIVFLNTIHLYQAIFIDFFGCQVNVLELLSFFLLLSAFIKSAQIGFHIWLPDSMEAPVPASALIHSATLVSAGIFLVLRFIPLFEITIITYFILPIIGSLTALYGGVVAMFTSDIKRILAYSTISHCGFLMVLSSTFIPEYVILYLFVHGFFKAAAFLCVGNIIRFSRNYQDFRYMGGFYKYLPFECFFSFICLFNLAGLPFSFGFFIKHLLFISVKASSILYYFIFFNCFFGAISGIIYSYRLFYNVFFDYKKAKKAVYLNANRIQLVSNKYYSNTTLGSNIAISLLVFFAYLIILYLFNVILTSNHTYSDFSNEIVSTNYTNFEVFSKSLLFNFSFFNYFGIIIIIILVLYSYRNMFDYYMIMNSFISFLIFSFFFWINLLIL